MGKGFEEQPAALFGLTPSFLGPFGVGVVLKEGAAVEHEGLGACGEGFSGVSVGVADGVFAES